MEACRRDEPLLPELGLPMEGFMACSAAESRDCEDAQMLSKACCCPELDGAQGA